MKIEGKILLIFFFYLFISTLNLKNYKYIEAQQTKPIINNTTEKFNLYKKLAETYNKQRPDSSIKYYLLASELTEDQKIKADFYYSIAINYNYQSDYDNAINFYKRSLAIYEKIKDSVGIGDCYYRLGVLASVKGNYVDALDYCYKAVAILNKSSNKKSQAFAHNYLGIVLYITGDLEKSEKQMYKAINFSQEVNDTTNIALANEHLAILFIRKNDFNRAKIFAEKSLELRQKINDVAGFAASYENLAIINRELKNYNKAFEFYNKSIQIKINLNSIRGVASSYLGIGRTYHLLGQYNKAIEYFNKSLDLRLKLKDKRGIASSYARLADSYEKLGDFYNALKFFKLSKDYSDSLLNERNSRNIEELKVKYEAKEREQKIQNLNIENQYYKNRINYLFVISILLIGFIIAILIAYNSKRKSVQTTTRQKEELEKLNEQLNDLILAKEKIYSIIAHDLKSPFQGMLGALELLETEFNNLTDNEKLHFIKGSYDLTKQTYRLLENLLEWSKIQTKKITFNPEETNLYLELFPTITQLKNTAKEKMINLIYEIDNNIIINIDKNMINTVIRNLVYNAIKFTNENGTIKIYSKETENEIEIFIEDNGIGMDEDILKNLFTFDKSISRKGTKNEKGTGLGLLLCKDIIEKHNGKINVKSEVGKGTTFSFTLSKNL